MRFATALRGRFEMADLAQPNVDTRSPNRLLGSSRPRFQPLAAIPSIKAKISLLIVLAIVVSALMSQIGLRFGWPIWVRPTAAAIVSLVLVQLLARGLTSPLREMASAATDLARGNYDHRIETSAVDEVGQLARAFTTMAGELAVVEANRRDLIANVSHELRTPIAGVRAQLENLADGVVAPSRDLFAELLLRVERLSRLVDDLLELSRLEAGVVALHRRDVVLARAVDDAVAEVTTSYPALEVQQNVDADLLLSADPDRLQQILVNLLENAATHGRAVGVRVVAGLVADHDRKHIEISILDDGPGIPVERAGHVFERFARLVPHTDSGPTETAPRGSGLGLAIVRGLVELHGGTVHVAERPAPGTCVVVRLPVAGDPRSLQHQLLR